MMGFIQPHVLFFLSKRILPFNLLSTWYRSSLHNGILFEWLTDVTSGWYEANGACATFYCTLLLIKGGFFLKWKPTPGRKLQTCTCIPHLSRMLAIGTYCLSFHPIQFRKELCTVKTKLWNDVIIYSNNKTTLSILIKHESCVSVCLSTFSEATKSPRVMKFWL